MKGRKITPVNAARVAILILGGLLGIAVADPAVTGRPGQRGEGRVGGVANFMELSTAEHRSGGAPSGPRAVRPRSRPSPGRRPAVPAGVSLSSDTDPAPTLVEADSLFSPASVPVSPPPAASFQA